ncbi:hypothetical protein MTO96_044375 [Rhipicephalus appendiculatus]
MWLTCSPIAFLTPKLSGKVLSSANLWVFSTKSRCSVFYFTYVRISSAKLAGEVLTCPCFRFPAAKLTSVIFNCADIRVCTAKLSCLIFGCTYFGVCTL